MDKKSIFSSSVDSRRVGRCEEQEVACSVAAFQANRAVFILGRTYKE